MQRSLDGAYECMVVYSGKLPRVGVTLVLVWELRCPRTQPRHQGSLRSKSNACCPSPAFHPCVEAASASVLILSSVFCSATHVPECERRAAGRAAAEGSLCPQPGSRGGYPTAQARKSQ